eukprot:TRINITY_DN54750_c0_g1_i1.p1 TRINITY_DN54750_c0_g1~~TRINITY_DN54750_c0_g1_i1.p1  ORF type:complete len:1083 (+),score=178.75 TRINITY_DN54750_c0_g1_i1:188-3436(+)
MANAGFSIPGIFERWKTDWIEPALGYIEGQRPKTDSHLNDVSIEYPEADLRAATNDFDPSVLLGSGTFGSVYKGTMRDGTEVAIKVLQVPEEAGFEEEVKVLSRFRHPNLVILMGFARHNETGGRSLIYEYLAGGDVSKRLQRSRKGTENFQWNFRISALLDAASGLSHLHNLPVRAFHRDIKSPNILLDRNNTAKMADFGLSCVSISSEHKVAQASGTVGYACPEYIRTGVITEFSEVHSFGMVILEVLTGAPPAVQRPDRPNEFCYLTDHLGGSIGKAVRMLDPSGNFPPALSQLLAETAFRCINDVPTERPLFKTLVEDLRRMVGEDWKQETVGPSISTALLNATSAVGKTSGGAPAGSPAVQSPKPYVGARFLPTPAPRPTLPGGGNAAALQGYGGSSSARGSIGGRATVGVPLPRKNSWEVGVTPVQTPQQQGLALQQQQVLQQQDSQGPVSMPQGQSQHISHLMPSQVPGPPPRLRPPAPSPQPSKSARDSPRGEGHATRFWCVFAEGVDLAKLTVQERAISFPENGSNELIVGRTAQASSVWDTLVPDRRFHGTVSREHFKVVQRPQAQSNNRGSAGASGCGGSDVSMSFSLICLSLNGMLLNGEFVRQTSGERNLRHGDVVAFAAASDCGNERVSASMPRKRFIAFSFQVGSPPASRHPPLGSSPIPKSPLLRGANLAACGGGRASDSGPIGPTDALEVTQPGGCLAGSRRTAEADIVVPQDTLFCLEAHGSIVRSDLSREARQIHVGPGADSGPPATLRVGLHHQRSFWLRVLKPSFLEEAKLSAALAADHFEVCASRRSNPTSNESSDWRSRWRFRLRVLSPVGVTVNYGVACGRGDERDLEPSDTLTVDDAPAWGSSAASASGDVPRGLHFTFIYTGKDVSASNGLPRELPTLDDADDVDGGPLVEKSSSHRASGRPGGRSNGTGGVRGTLPANACRAGALLPPTGMLNFGSEDHCSDDAQPPPQLGPVKALRSPVVPYRRPELSARVPSKETSNAHNAVGGVGGPQGPPSMEGGIGPARTTIFQAPMPQASVTRIGDEKLPKNASPGNVGNAVDDMDDLFSRTGFRNSVG